MNGTSLQKEHKVTTKLYFFTLIIIYRKTFPKIIMFTGTILGTVNKTLKMTDFVAGYGTTTQVFIDNCKA